MEPQVGSRSSSSSSDYDVFINFKGEDTCKIFVGLLYSALKDRGIYVFIDSKDLWKGEDIGPELLGTLKGSKLSIVVFSERYAESRWCLRELFQILEYYRINGQVIIPIFFKVKTSDVKNQTGSFEISPQRHAGETPETLRRWKDALRAVCDKKGWVFEDGCDQSELVEKVVKNAWIQLTRVALIDVKHPVGLESRVHSVSSLLSTTHSKDVQFLGIYGLGGIGKTTIATAVYNHICRNFTKSCFIDNVREKALQPNGIVYLQEELLYNVFREEIKICSPTEGSRLIKETLGKTDILLVLDDVDHHTQLEALAGDINWFGPGSRIIITTRDQSILGRIHQVNRKVYEPTELSAKDALRLFSSYAFNMDQPPNDYMEFSVKIVRTIGRLPLALEVLGSDLSMKRDKEVWKSKCRMLKAKLHGWCLGIRCTQAHWRGSNMDQILGEFSYESLIHTNRIHHKTIPCVDQSRMRMILEREPDPFSKGSRSWITVNCRSPRPFDIFINHRGVDTKHNLAALLYDSFIRLNLCPFLDYRSMKPGEKLHELIETAMRECKVVVAIFSPNYCGSDNCLRELAVMMESEKKVIPIFYDVDPSDLVLVGDGSFPAKQLHRFRSALQLAKRTVGILFNSCKGDWSDLLKIVSDRVVEILMEFEEEGPKRRKLTIHPQSWGSQNSIEF